MSPLVLLLIGITIVVGGILTLRLHAFLALVLGAFAVALLTPQPALQTYAATRVKKTEWSAEVAKKFPDKAATARVAEEFGRTCATFGLLIAMASILGEAMLHSGGAEAIATALLRALGAARAHWAFFLTSFFLTIPVFFETTFYLLSPLTKAVARETKKNYLLLVMCTVAGGTITHSLVPPSAGPLFVAQELGVPLPQMMGMGCLIGFGAALFGCAFAMWSNRRHTLEVPPEDAAAVESALHRTLPPLALSLIPVTLPVFLIALSAWVNSPKPAPGVFAAVVRVLGEKEMALTLGACCALLLLAWKRDRAATNKAVGHALTGGATVLLIICAGGAFGGVLRQTGISEVLGSMLAGMQTFALPALFLITTLVRTAQGSATVAMITSAPIAKAFIDNGSAHVHPVYFAIAIGCGSKPFPWMNDGGFWIISRLSGLREDQTLRTVSPMMSLQGVAGLVITMIVSWLWPMR
ncbi:MAG: GntP family permease [Chthoniobacter sp.]|uniref:GntP family permease n=1 Tax=Chthoniobacter sp. TaxID=2510640 RepID=UPI0032A69B1E